MYNESQIREILESKIEILKKAEGKKKLPEFTEIYKESVEYAERISIHSEIGKFPANLFKKRAPNQTDEEFEYLAATYKTTSFPIWERFMGFINRIWNDQNWSISWPENESLTISEEETPEAYVQNQYPIFGSLESYYKNIVTPTKEKDANALLTHKPYYIPVKQDGENNLMVDEGQLIKPVACIFSAENVIAFLDGEYAIVKTHEKSWVAYGNGKEQTGLIFEFYDHNNIWKLIQTGKKVDYTFEIVPYWSHNLGYAPFKKLKGKPIYKEMELLYQSHFMAAVEPMDDILLDSSYLRAIKAGHAFPHKWEYVDECTYDGDFGRCIDGKVIIDGRDSECPKCKGQGVVRPSSPLGITQIKMPNQNNTGSNTNLHIPPFDWVAPDPAIMEFLRKEIESNKLEALSILNLFSNSDPKGGETALGKQIDREDSFSFIQSISNQNFELFDFSHKVILQMRYGSSVGLPEISYPKNFAIRNEVELTEELANAKAKGLPEIALRKILQEYLITRFNTQEEAMKAVDLTFYADRLICLSTQEIAQKKIGGTIANYEDILHTSIYYFIANATSLDPLFFEKTLEEQKIIIVQMAKDKETEITPKKLNPDTILANAGNTGSNQQ
jgi:hypothetical protein